MMAIFLPMGNLSRMPRMTRGNLRCTFSHFHHQGRDGKFHSMVEIRRDGDATARNCFTERTTESWLLISCTRASSVREFRKYYFQSAVAAEGTLMSPLTGNGSC